MANQIRKTQDPDGRVFTNDLKKGDEAMVHGAWCKINDNLKGNIRQIEALLIGGGGTEIGSCYAWEIVQAKWNGQIVPVFHTPAQMKNKKLVRAALP